MERRVYNGRLMARVLIQGTVTKLLGGASSVDAGPDGVFTCDLRGRLFRKEGLRLAVGDRVAIAPADDGAPEGEPGGVRRAVIEEVAPRRSALRRVRDFKRDQVLCANVDRIFIVVAAVDPPYKRPFIDRLLVGAARDELPTTLVVNKLDLAQDDDYLALIDEDLDVYARLGVPSLRVSAATGEGVEALREALRDRISAVVGPSGVGKSTLLNAVCPGLALRTGEVSEVDGRGRHTTTAAELVRLPGGGFVIDTPGLRAFGLWDLQPDELLIGFQEIEEAAAGCRFTNCGHREEPGCAVRQAVEEGAVDPERYASFLKLRDEVEAEAALRQATRRR